MTNLETVALAQQRWRLTFGTLKESEFVRFRLVMVSSLAGAILEALALQIYGSYPVASAAVGYAGAAALAVGLVVRAQGFGRERAQAWVLALAVSQSLKSEMYRYRTSSGPYSDRLGANPEVTLLQRCDAMLAKVKSIEKYAVEPDLKTLSPLGPLDADAYLSERVNGEMSRFREYTDNLPKIENSWLKAEYFLAIAGVLSAAALTLTHNQTYAGWAVVLIAFSLASGVTAKADRYAVLNVGNQAVKDRLNNILAQWRANRSSLDELVERVEETVLKEGLAWIFEVDECFKDTVSSSPKPWSPELVLHSPGSRAGD
jgi:hypothetical protein